jgi:hypothetical protein
VNRVAAIGASVIVLLAASCSEGDYQVDRRGGPFPTAPIDDPPLGSAGSPALGEGGAAGGGSASAGGAGSGALIRFCDALTVARAKCQRCHSNPTQNGAPVPFVTYEDFHAIYSEPKRWWQRAQEMVEVDYMPYLELNDPPTSLMPPVEPLTADEKATLMGWFMQGALPEGGTECPE